MRLLYRLNRGPSGFGIDVDSYNFIVGMQAGGQGQLDGLIRPGDSVLAVDGAPLTGAQQQQPPC
jgi:C-terminal processing protease CtpA/Prc